MASSVSPQDAIVNAQVSALRRYLWWANVATVAALASGVLVAGAGGRLVMRVLAVTSPVSAQGRLTEALANVGFPTLGGSIALFIFGGLPAGFAAAFIYLLIHRWLPAGRWAGPLLGVFLLLLFGASVEPLRADNIDFAIVGPGWLSVVLFSVLAVLHGAVVAAVAGAFSRHLPLPFGKNWKYYLPLLAAILFVPAGVVLGVGALAAMVWSRLVPAAWGMQRSAGGSSVATSGASGMELPAAARRRTAVTWAGPGLLGVAAIAALPLFISTVISIVSR
ncbi:hypothetical protein [Arthrobacter sp. ISL-72]|uniref:hypothetical protein n=1 Tax=Arthrobacter sp. ISL-72 TaxID=2819114 RepID=UPI001BE5D7F7|nr:hypothetical protein [Arthrobacter sp. ISL-72]MBT2597246.1 hypothetical protein [Arthrobacter sp. ISL-72]